MKGKGRRFEMEGNKGEKKVGAVREDMEERDEKRKGGSKAWKKRRQKNTQTGGYGGGT